MDRRTVKGLAAVVVGASLTYFALVAPAGVASSGSAAKARHVSFKNVGSSNTSLAGKLSGSFGNGTQSGQLLIPKLFYVWKYHAGTIKATGNSNPPKGSIYTGTWTITGGTGKFKHIKGHGTFHGDAAAHPPIFYFTGTVSY